MSDGTEIGSLYYDIDAPNDKLTASLNDSDEKVKSFADKLQTGLNKAAAGFAVIGAGLTLVSKQATDFAVDAVKNAKALGMQIGVSTEEASRLTAAFGRMGVSAESAAQMFGIFSKNIVQATKDSKNQGLQTEQTQISIDKTTKAIADVSAQIKSSGDKSGDLTLKLRELNNTLATQKQSLDASTNSFQKLGINTVDAQGNQKDFNTILFEVADKFKGMPDGIDKTTIALNLFGRQGKDMVKVLDQGSAGIKDLEEKADKLGLTLTASNITAISDYIKSQKDLKDSTDAMKIAIGTTTAPVLAEFNKKLNEVVTNLLQSNGAIKDVTVGFLAFGGPIFAATSALFGFASAVVQVGEAIGFGMLGAIGIALIAFVALGVAIYEMIQHAEELGTVFVVVTDQIQMAVRDVFDWIMTNWPYLLGALAGPFGLAVAFILMHLGEIKNAITNAASDAWNWLYKAGTDIVGGLVQGIKDKVNDAVTAIKNIGSSIIKAARAALDWHSPSKVFVEAGRSISEGMALGINRSANMALSAMDSLSNAVISPTVNGGSSGSTSGGGGSSTTFGDTVVNIGQINNAQDESHVIRVLDRNQALESKGLSPAV